MQRVIEVKEKKREEGRVNKLFPCEGRRRGNNSNLILSNKGCQKKKTLNKLFLEILFSSIQALMPRLSKMMALKMGRRRIEFMDTSTSKLE